jgi:hypothetical protein
MPVTWLHVADLQIREGDGYDRSIVLNALGGAAAFPRRGGNVPRSSG